MANCQLGSGRLEEATAFRRKASTGPWSSSSHTKLVLVVQGYSTGMVQYNPARPRSVFSDKAAGLHWISTSFTGRATTCYGALDGRWLMSPLLSMAPPNSETAMAPPQPRLPVCVMSWATITLSRVGLFLIGSAAASTGITGRWVEDALGPSVQSGMPGNNGGNQARLCALCGHFASGAVKGTVLVLYEYCA